jgi:inward rectifier potassium channel
MSIKERANNFSVLLRKVKSKPLERELGFGRNVATEGRLMNPDGSFNVVRQHLNPWDNIYYYLITMPWSAFFLLTLGFFVLLNALFASVYYAIGVEYFNGITPGDGWHHFMQAFFFSSQTLTTVGYGHISPVGLTTSLLASFESFLGLLTFALVSGLLYGRFSRPRAHVIFSEKMLVAPYREGQGLMFRMGNARRSELIETEVQMLAAMNQRNDDGTVGRNFYPLELEISKVNFFSLSWTLVHALNEKSPLTQFSAQDLLDANTEIMVLVKGTDETNQQSVHTRHSYTADEIVWNARFRPVIARNKKGQPHMMTPQIGDYEVLEDIVSPS